ncbi:MAG: acyltransferase [Pseudomonadota bacterium]|nr:acyltransferase [Pseudomonadota bacterium]MDQ3160275.1 acyltransferase [Pseudomonadota bacterium]
MSSPTIAAAWATQRNNFNLMRLIAAWLVIYSHAWAITGTAGHDLMGWLTGFRSAGALAVDLFFVASGFLIAASLQRNSVRGYLVSRGLRILPALIVCVGVTTFVLGPLLTTATDYWSQPTTWDYFIFNASLLLSRFQLPGVFTAHPLDAVNGSLWTLPIEAKLYLLLMLASLLGLLAPTRYTLLWALAIIAGYALAWHYWPLPDHIQKYAECTAFFITGSLLWVNRERIRLNGWVVLGLLALVALLRGSTWAHLPYFSLLTYGTLYLGLRARLPMIHRTDFSYGLYLYGWPAQQLAWMLPWGKSIVGNIVIATMIALTCAALSWFLIERPALRLKMRWVARGPQASPVAVLH